MDNEKSNQNIISFSFVIAGFIAFGVTYTVFEILAEAFGAVARLRAQEVFKQGLPVAVGFAVFLALFLNPKIYVWADECVGELRKVVWPSRKDTIAMTTVCCVMVVVAGIGFGVFDFFASQLIKVFVR